MTVPNLTREDLMQTQALTTLRRPGTVAEWTAGADFDIFTVTGIVLVSNLFGVCTALITGAIVPLLEITTTVPVATVPLCALAASLTGDVAGSVYGWSGLLAGVLTPGAAVGMQELAATNTWTGGFLILTDGVINVENAIASTTGVIDWDITYIPMSADGAVTLL